MKIDTNGNGVLSLDEFKIGSYIYLFKKLLLIGMAEFTKEIKVSLTDKEFEKLFIAMDIDGSGTIDYSGTLKLKNNL